MTAYCTKEDIQGLGNEFTIPSAWSDDAITNMIAEVQYQINELIKDDYSGTQSLTLTVDGSGDSVLYTSFYTKLPIISISSVNWREDTAHSFATEGLWTSSDFTAHKNFIEATGAYSSVRASTRSYFVKGIQNYRIIGTFGHASVHSEIKRMAVLLCRDRVQAGYLNQMDITSVGWDDYRLSSASNKRDLVGYTGYPIVDVIIKRFLRKTIPIMKV